jgi:hypothetical protein
VCVCVCICVYKHVYIPTSASTLLTAAAARAHTRTRTRTQTHTHTHTHTHTSMNLGKHPGSSGGGGAHSKHLEVMRTEALEERLDPRERQLAASICTLALVKQVKKPSRSGWIHASAKLPTSRVTCWLSSAHSRASAAKWRRARVHPAAMLAAVHRGGRVQASTLD